jgi:gas vesicle protein GvpL/GvpF
MRTGRAPALRLFGVVPARAAEAVPMPPGIRLIGFREAAAAVRDQPAGRRTPNQPDVTEHCAVVAAIFAHCTVVPSPPGVLFRTMDAVSGWLEVHHAALGQAIAHVDGRAEARVHLRRLPPAAHGDGVHVGEPTTAEAAALNAEAHEVFQLLGRDLPSWVTNTRAAANRPAAVPLSAMAHSEERSATASTREPVDVLAASGAARDVLEASASFLVDRSQWRAFADRVAVEVRRDSALAAELTGPWPPYDFVRMEFGG